MTELNSVLTPKTITTSCKISKVNTVICDQ